MAFRRRNLDIPRVDLTPMIDVVFLLLIFFMISTTFVERSGLKVDLPDTSARELLTEEQELKVYLGKHGEIYLQQQRIHLPALAQKLNSYGADAAKMTFMLMADKEALHGKVIELMDAAKNAGFGQLAIATDNELVENN